MPSDRLPRTAPARKPPPPPGATPRAHERYDLIAQVELREGDEVSLLEVRNISLGGVLLRRKADELPGVRVGDEVLLYMHLGHDDGGNALELTAPARVVRIEGSGDGREPGIALMFTSADATVASRLAHILRFISGAG